MKTRIDDMAYAFDYFEVFTIDYLFLYIRNMQHVSFICKSKNRITISFFQIDYNDLQ